MTKAQEQLRSYVAEAATMASGTESEGQKDRSCQPLANLRPSDQQDRELEERIVNLKRWLDVLDRVFLVCVIPFACWAWLLWRCRP